MYISEISICLKPYPLEKKNVQPSQVENCSAVLKHNNSDGSISELNHMQCEGKLLHFQDPHTSQFGILMFGKENSVVFNRCEYNMQKPTQPKG